MFEIMSDFHDQALKRKREVFFEDYADGTLKFSNGKIMKVSIPILALESSVIGTLFQNAGRNKKRRTGSRSSSSAVEITDFDYITFELFIECLMGFKECTADDAVVIFPVAWKYKTEKLIKKLLTILEPSDLNKNVCLGLNMAISSGCEQLTNTIVTYLEERRLIYRLLSDEELFFVLEPESVAKLLEDLDIDSCILLKLFKWAENYLIKTDAPIELRPFFTKHKIMDALTIDCFETTKAYFKFNKTELGKDFFSAQEFQEHVELNGYVNRDSAWVEVKAGDTITEKFVIKKVIFLSTYTTIIKIYRSSVVFYDYPEEDDDDKEEMIEYTTALKKVGSQFNLKRSKTNDNSAQVRNPTFSIFKIDLKTNVVCDLEVEVDISFNYDGRILKKSQDQFKHLTCEDEKQPLFFMDYAKFSYKEKIKVKKEKSPEPEDEEDENEEDGSDEESDGSSGSKDNGGDNDTKPTILKPLTQ